MKKLLLNLLKRKDAKLNVFLVLVLLFSVGFGCKFNTDDKTGADDKKTERTKDDDSKVGLDDKKTEQTNSVDEKTEQSKDDSDDEPVENPDASTLEIPSNEQLVAMADESMRNFEKAASSGDFSDFYDTLANAWKKETSANDLEKGFKIFIDNSSDVAKIRPLKPEITGTPNIKKELGFDMLNVDGKYDTSPRNVKFELKYIPEGKDWKLSFIKVNTKN
ncbi:hypothetical protein BH20ACI1_BH20ACI1_23150 [soil metagenome]